MWGSLLLSILSLSLGCKDWRLYLRIQIFILARNQPVTCERLEFYVFERWIARRLMKDSALLSNTASQVAMRGVNNALLRDCIEPKRQQNVGDFGDILRAYLGLSHLTGLRYREYHYKWKTGSPNNLPKLDCFLCCPNTGQSSQYWRKSGIILAIANNH